MKKIFRFLVWLCIFNVSILGALSMGLTNVKASSAPEVQFEKEFSAGLKSYPHPEIKIELTGGPVAHDLEVNYEVNVALTTAEKTDFELYGDSILIFRGQDSVNLPLTILNNDKVELPKKIVVDLTSVEPNPYDIKLGSQTQFTYTLYNLPVTSVDMVSPDGLNGWYKSVPEIKLSAQPTDADTFYQWNDTDKAGWLKYDSATPLYASEGKNTLFYYSVEQVSVSAGGTVNSVEEIQKMETKVDTTAPGKPIFIKANVNDDGSVDLSWGQVSDAGSYELLRTDQNQIIALTSLSYNDSSVIRGRSYEYRLVSVDEAGNYSGYVSIFVSVPSLQVVTNPTPIAEKAVFKKEIGSGVYTKQSVQEKPAQIAPESPQEVAGASQTENEEDSNNWSRLILAISILMIAAGVAIGGYYGYEWLVERKNNDNGKTPPSSKSRW